MTYGLLAQQFYSNLRLLRVTDRLKIQQMTNCTTDILRHGDMVKIFEIKGGGYNKYDLRIVHRTLAVKYVQSKATDN